MNKKRSIVLIVFLFLLIGGILLVWFNSISDNPSKNQYEADKTTTNLKVEYNSLSSESTKAVIEEQNNPEGQDSQNSASTVKEEQIAIFSTKVYSNDPARQNNINITCNTLNGTIVKNGATFSFCNTVGQASSAKGYQKADIFDNQGHKKKGLGGGNCQISTTLYNAVLATPGLNVTERHAHSNYVSYIQKGKDAAVAYGSYDLKFVNNTGNDIKICAEANSQSVTVSIISLR